jgi:hypothetical protein
MVFTPKLIGPHMSFTPSFGFSLTSYSSLNQKSCQNKILQIFVNLVTKFPSLSKLGLKQGSQVKLGPKDRVVTSRINFIKYMSKKNNLIST